MNGPEDLSGISIGAALPQCPEIMHFPISEIHQVLHLLGPDNNVPAENRGCIFVNPNFPGQRPKNGGKEVCRRPLLRLMTLLS